MIDSEKNNAICVTNKCYHEALHLCQPGVQPELFPCRASIHDFKTAGAGCKGCTGSVYVCPKGPLSSWKLKLL